MNDSYSMFVMYSALCVRVESSILAKKRTTHSLHFLHVNYEHDILKCNCHNLVSSSNSVCSRKYCKPSNCKQLKYSNHEVTIKGETDKDNLRLLAHHWNTMLCQDRHKLSCELETLRALLGCKDFCHVWILSQPNCNGTELEMELGFKVEL